MSSPYIRLRSGGHFDFQDPERSHFTLEDIAWGLAHINRFNGQTKRPISVAQHSINVSYLVSPNLALTALMHDAAEAFLGDVTTPLKEVLGENFKSLERITEYMITQRFKGLTTFNNPNIKHADLVCLATERMILLENDPGEPWDCLEGIQPLQDSEISQAWTYFAIGSRSCPENDYTLFMRRYQELQYANFHL